VGWEKLFAKKRILIMCFFYALNGGISTSTFQIPEQQQVIYIFADVRAFLATLIIVNILGFAKAMFHAINFLSGKIELTPE